MLSQCACAHQRLSSCVYVFTCMCMFTSRERGGEGEREREGALAYAFAIKLCLKARTSHLTKRRMFQLPVVSSTRIPRHFLLMRLDKLEEVLGFILEAMDAFIWPV